MKVSNGHKLFAIDLTLHRVALFTFFFVKCSPDCKNVDVNGIQVCVLSHVSIIYMMATFE
jgi:hypothetical protein